MLPEYLYIKMKKARNIKVIKSRSTGRIKEIALTEEICQAAAKKCHASKVVNDWVREHLEQKQVARQFALNLLYNSGLPDQVNDKNPNY